MSKSAISAAFNAVLNRYQITEAHAARSLLVSRQSFNRYRQGKTAPNRHVVARAVQLWGQVMTEHGFDREEAALGVSTTQIAQPFQLTLFSEEFQGSRATVRVESRSAQHVELALTVEIA